MHSNQAAYLTAKGASPLSVSDAPYTSPGADQVTVKNYAFAINPCDGLVQQTGMFVKQWPFILGCDVAGTIEEVGPNVTHLKPGDRVLSSTQGVGGPPEQAGFQKYTLSSADVVSKIPDSLSFEQACVLPLSLLTAGTCFYLENHIGLALPSVDAKDQDAYVFVWGGSSSVGSTAIQLARGSGYKVITTSSPKNKAYCEELGAEKVFDYNSDTLVDEVVEYLEGKTLAGSLDSISKGTVEKVVQIARRTEGSKKIMVTTPGTEKGHPDDVQVKWMFAEMRGMKEAKVLFNEYVPKALATGQLMAKPEAMVVGKGLESLQAGINRQQEGVSAAKVVVSL